MLACRERFNFNIAKRKISKNLFFLIGCMCERSIQRSGSMSALSVKIKVCQKVLKMRKKTDGLKEQV